jgi:hypothetical protein
MSLTISTETLERYLRFPLQQMAVQAGRLDDEQVNQRPAGESTNSVAVLITHTCAVVDFWLGHVGRGLPSERDRDSEFDTHATVAQLQELVAATINRLKEHAEAFASGATVMTSEIREFLPEGDTTDGSLYLHVVEEVFQHLGHIDLSIDAILS